MKKPIGILGGTFDPIHNGHLIVANQVLQMGKFAEIKFVPCKFPVHKQSTHATERQRQEMIRLAIMNSQNLSLDMREIYRETPSYMIETLESFRKEFPDTPLILIIGMDGFLNLPHWKNWTSLTDYAHILVVSRPGFELLWTPELEQQFKNKITTNMEVLSNQLAGFICFFCMDALPISSSEIREQIKNGVNLKQFVPQPVIDYMLREKIYSQ